MALQPISRNIILASKSPRRQNLLKELGYDFEIRTKEIEEVYPPELKRENVALYLSGLKAEAFFDDLKSTDLIITSDTIVCLGDEIIGKPKDKQDALNMLRKLSDNKHEVITAVTLLSKEKRTSFFTETEVYFKELTSTEIEYYVDKYQPYDKAGGYGIQEWIGYIGIQKIVGSYFNVMGLPVHQLYEELINF
jgi:septum formation protein